jgi:hypothetical protein
MCRLFFTLGRHGKRFCLQGQYSCHNERRLHELMCTIFVQKEQLGTLKEKLTCSKSVIPALQFYINMGYHWNTNLKICMHSKGH